MLVNQDTAGGRISTTALQCQPTSEAGCTITACAKGEGEKGQEVVSGARERKKELLAQHHQVVEATLHALVSFGHDASVTVMPPQEPSPCIAACCRLQKGIAQGSNSRHYCSRYAKGDDCCA